MGEEGDLVAPRLARGSRCFVVSVDGTIAGYGWLSTASEWIGELQLKISPRPGEGYIWNCVTLKEHRRKGVFRSLLLGISATARAEGMRRLWIGTVAVPAERALEPSGFRPALRFGFLRLAGLHSMQVTAAGEPPLVAEASAVLGVRPGLRALARAKKVRH
jgi:GNAT superfamily N-acetyltransferase